jgi:hypothetical protein
LIKRFPGSIALPKIGDVSTDVLLFCGSVVVGTVVILYRNWWNDVSRSRRRKSKSFVDPREEARKHAWTRSNGFKDKSLYEFIDVCVSKRNSLRKVADPDTTRKAKIHQMKAANQARPKGPLGLSPDRLQTERRRLQNVTNKPSDYHDVNGA